MVTYTLCRNHFHGVVAVHPVLLPPPPGVHAGHVPRLVGPPRGSDVPHDPPRQNATHAQMEPVRSLTRGGALRSANTHPVTPSTLGARVVGVLGPPVVAVAAQGVAPSGYTSPSTRCARPDAARCSAGCRDLPSHAQHARRARGGRARASRHSGGVTGGVSCGVHSVHGRPSTRGARPDVRRRSTWPVLQDLPSHNRAKFVILSVPWDRQPGPTKLRTQCGVWRQRRLYGFTPLRN